MALRLLATSRQLFIRIGCCRYVICIKAGIGNGGFQLFDIGPVGIPLHLCNATLPNDIDLVQPIHKPGGHRFNDLLALLAFRSWRFYFSPLNFGLLGKA